MEWTDSKINSLITMYETKPCLYDFKSEHYHYRQAKATAWQEVADFCETTGMAHCGCCIRIMAGVSVSVRISVRDGVCQLLY